MKLNKETRFSIGDTIYFLETTGHGIELTHDDVLSVEAHFYKSEWNEHYLIQYITRGGKKTYEGSCWESEQEAQAYLSRPYN